MKMKDATCPDCEEPENAVAWNQLVQFLNRRTEEQ